MSGVEKNLPPQDQTSALQKLLMESDSTNISDQIGVKTTFYGGRRYYIMGNEKQTFSLSQIRQVAKGVLASVKNPNKLTFELAQLHAIGNAALEKRNSLTQKLHAMLFGKTDHSQEQVKMFQSVASQPEAPAEAPANQAAPPVQEKRAEVEAPSTGKPAQIHTASSTSKKPQAVAMEQYNLAFNSAVQGNYKAAISQYETATKEYKGKDGDVLTAAKKVLVRLSQDYTSRKPVLDAESQKDIRTFFEKQVKAGNDMATPEFNAIKRYDS